MVTKTYFKDYLKNNSIICVNNIEKRLIYGTMISLCLLLEKLRKTPKIRNFSTVRKGGAYIVVSGRKNNPGFLFFCIKSDSK